MRPFTGAGGSARWHFVQHGDRFASEARADVEGAEDALVADVVGQGEPGATVSVHANVEEITETAASVVAAVRFGVDRVVERR